MIKQEAINELTDRIRIDELIGEVVKLKRAGSNLTGLCPFHDEKTPSFMVSPAKGIYKCFGCGASGNAFKFVMETQCLSFPEAVKHLAAKYGVIVHEDRSIEPEDDDQRQQKDKLLAMNKAAMRKYQELLMNTIGVHSGAALHAKEYLTARGITEDITIQWQLGFAPDDWRFLADAIVEKGLTDDAIAIGLIAQKDDRQFDFFRGRIMFPIHDIFMNVIGFGGRDIQPKEVQKEKGIAKYMNSRESVLFRKSTALYGIPFAYQHIRKDKSAILVEGYTDVISFHAAGAMNTVATCGTALTEHHCRVLKKYTDHVIIARDGDGAGINAAMRDIDLLLQADIKADLLPIENGEDPDTIARKFLNHEIEA